MSILSADEYSGARLLATNETERQRYRCHFSVGRSPTCVHPHPPTPPLYSCTMADGSIRHFHTACLPLRLLYHSVPHARYSSHIPGLSHYLSDWIDPHQYLRDLDERLKADCADIVRHVDDSASGSGSSEREVALFLNQSVASYFVCVICVDKVIHLPVSTGCHIFCRHCWDQWLLSSTPAHQRDSVSCPACRASIDLSRVHPIEGVMQRVVASLMVRCVYSARGCAFTCEYGLDGETARGHSRGSCAFADVRCTQCDWRGRRSLLASHHCHPPLPCPHPGCSCSGPSEWLAHHVNHCPRKQLQCNTCHQTYPRSEANVHTNAECVYRCKHCHLFIAKAKQAQHQQNSRYRLCSEFLPCANGCGAPVLRGVQDKHNDTCEEALVTCNHCPRSRRGMKRKNFPSHWDKCHSHQAMDSDDDNY